MPEALALAGDWWVALGADPRAAGMSALDWLSALDTAEVLHAFLDSDVKLAGEVRIRKEALERRLRELAELGLPDAGEVGAEDERPTGTAGAPSRARARRGPLTAV